MFFKHQFFVVLITVKFLWQWRTKSKNDAGVSLCTTAGIDLDIYHDACVMIRFKHAVTFIQNWLIKNFTMSETIIDSSSVAKATPDDVDKILQIIMNEVTKIEKNEETDYGYTKMIFFALIMIGVLLIKTKLYKISACFKKKKKKDWKRDVGKDKYSRIQLQYNTK